MMCDHETAPKPGGRKTGLAAKFLAALALASAVVLLTGIAGWQALRTTHQEVKTMRLAANGDGAAAMADRILLRIDEAGWELGAGVFVAIALLAGMYLYLVRTVVQPLRTGARLMDRLAVGDGREDVPARELARNDEIGDLARAIRDLIAYQREEVGIADTMSAGDFTRAMTVRDPADAVGLAMRRMAGATVETLGRVNAHAGQVMTDGQAIASASGELSANSAGIAAAASEISNNIAQIKTRADDNAGMAGQAGRLADSGGRHIERGYEDIGEMGVVMLNMQACGDKIVGIAKSIGDIAFQTNLLALNANVEAARAGRHGKGFTIVAEEVRRLSARTGKAAEETSTLMKETVEQVELAAAIAGRINATFAEMQASVQEADALLAKIAAASNEQSGGIDHISAALHRVDRSARENMEHAGRILKKADNLVGQTGTLRRVMGRFRLNSGLAPDAETFAEPDGAVPAVRAHRAIGAAGWEP